MGTDAHDCSAGCSTGGSDADDADSSPTPAPTATSRAAASTTPTAAPNAAEKAAVLSAYGRMWEEPMKAYRKASDAGGPGSGAGADALRKAATQMGTPYAWAAAEQADPRPASATASTAT
ncbi:hypothetical protein ABZ835_47270 [Streptomyces sp. NPDC047461]|uniref:hypothetical protein n=1 Tax=Streptomyces sp. NPDC047461 TaxID=3155619 RepID=UPI0033C7B321